MPYATESGGTSPNQLPRGRLSPTMSTPSGNPETMTAISYVEFGDQAYALTTNVGSGWVQVGYRGGPRISTWDPEQRNTWVASYEGFDSFLRSGHESKMLDYLKQFDLVRREYFKSNRRDI
jgi:hypothetical protein